MNIILDIETAPHRPEHLRAAGWKPSRSYRAKEWSESEDDYWDAWHSDTAQLDPARSWVCAIGLYLPELGAARYFWAKTPEEERSAILLATETLAGIHPFGEVTLRPETLTVIGHNVLKFDLPYLAARCLALGIAQALPIRQVIDTKAAFEARYQVRGASSSSLDCICRLLGLPVKPGNGKDFWLMPREQQQEYLQHDLVATWAVALRIGVVEPAPEAAEAVNGDPLSVNSGEEDLDKVTLDSHHDVPNAASTEEAAQTVPTEN
jgi:hypothetical protein